MRIQAKERLLSYIIRDMPGLSLVENYKDSINLLAKEVSTNSIKQLDPNVWTTVQGRNRYLWYVSNSNPLPTSYLCLEKESFGWCTFTSFTLPKFRGQNHGWTLYQSALDLVKVLYSSDELSKGSTAVWKKLCEAHRGKVFLPATKHKIAIVGWNEIEGYKWPVVLDKNGQEITLLDLVDSDNHLSAKAAEKSRLVVSI